MRHQSEMNGCIDKPSARRPVMFIVCDITNSLRKPTATQYYVMYKACLLVIEYEVRSPHKYENT